MERGASGQYQLVAKRFKSTDPSSGSDERRNFECGRYRKFYGGRCQSFTRRTCGKEGHFGSDCKQSMLVCFHCGQEGHIRAHSPLDNYLTDVIGQPKSRRARFELLVLRFGQVLHC